MTDVAGEKPRRKRVLVAVFAGVWLLVLALWVMGRSILPDDPLPRGAHGTVSAPPDPYLTQVAGDAQRALGRWLDARPASPPTPKLYGWIEVRGRRAALVLEAERGGRKERVVAVTDPARIPDEVPRLAEEATRRIGEP